jgi:hypothetical protein
MVNQGYIRCPKCNKDDLVRKVSAVVAAGKITGGVVPLETPLSKDLSPPDSPTYQSPWGPGTIIGLAVLFLFACSGLHFVFDASTPNPLSYLIVTILFFLGPAAWIIWAKLKTAPLRKAAYAARYARWQSAHAQWEKLYFCHRDDGVFLPDGRSPLVPRSLMASYCGFP